VTVRPNFVLYRFLCTCASLRPGQMG
jgi:hypothetical protein